MRNVAVRKLRSPKALKALRRIQAGFYGYPNTNGTTTLLNLTKHLMLNKRYTYPEYQMAMIEFANQQFKMKKQKETYKNKLDKENKKEDNVEKEETNA